MDIRRPALPLSALRAFEAAARLGSFKAAAGELGVTPAAISHQVKGLESLLRIPLFDRLHRSLRLTASGAKLAASASTAFDGLARCLWEMAEMGAVAGPSTVKVTAAPSFATKWLAPRLHRFQAQHPRFEVALDASERRVDLGRETEVDVAIRYGPPPADDSRLVVTPLWQPGEVIAVCAPGFAREAALCTPADLLGHMLIRTAQPSLGDKAGHKPIGWSAWMAAAGAASIAPSGPFFGTTQLAIEAAIAGQGIILSPAVLVQEDLRSGRLVRPFPTSLPDPSSYWLLFRKDRAETPRVRAFARWLLEEARQSEIMLLERFSPKPAESVAAK